MHRVTCICYISRAITHGMCSVKLDKCVTEFIQRHIMSYRRRFIERMSHIHQHPTRRPKSVPTPPEQTKARLPSPTNLSRISSSTRLRLSPKGEGGVGGLRGAPQSRVEDARAHLPRLRLHRSLFRIFGLLSHIRRSFPYEERPVQGAAHTRTRTRTHACIHTHAHTHTDAGAPSAPAQFCRRSLIKYI